MMKGKLIKIILLVVGTLSLAVGALGIFVPLLPTTPLLLLAAFCYLRSSEKLYNRLMNSMYLGQYIRNYVENKSITKRVRNYTLVVLWVSLVVSAILIDNLAVRLILGAVGIGVSIHLFMLKSAK